MPDDELSTPAGEGEEIAPTPSPVQQPPEEVQDLNNDPEPASPTPLQAIEEGLQTIAEVDAPATTPVDAPEPEPVAEPVQVPTPLITPPAEAPPPEPTPTPTPEPAPTPTPEPEPAPTIDATRLAA